MPPAHVQDDQSYRIFFERALEGLYRSTVEGRLTEVNPAFAEMLGYASTDEVMAIDVQRDLYVESKDREAMLAKVRRAGKVEQHNVPIQKKDGSLAYIHDYTRGIFEDGELVGLEGILTDVTEQVRLSNQLRESEKRYRTLLQHLPVGVYRTTPEGEILEANTAAIEMIGATSLQHLRQHDAADFMLERGLRAQHMEKLASGKHRVEEFPFQCLDGRKIWVRDYMRAVEDEQGNIRYLDGVIIDITEQRRAEIARRESDARYRLLVEQFPEPIVVHDGKRILYANAASARFAGIEDADGLMGRDIFDFIHPDFLASATDRVTSIVQQRKPAPPIEGKLEMPDGRAVDVEIISSPVRFKGKEASQVLLRDMTERKLHESQLVEAKERAEEMSELKSAFLANMSHEVRTPLTGILGFASILKEELQDEKQELAEYIHQSGERLLETLNSVLDLARLEANALTLDIEPVDVATEVRQTAVIFRPIAAEKGLTLSVDVPDELVVRTDRTCLHRVFSNLLSNGIKFTNEGSIHVRLACEGDHLLIRVEDTGPGIAPDFVPYVFDEFKQASTGLSREHQGAGLGLAITKRLIDRLNGDISIDSTVGQGSVFTVRLPSMDVI